MIGLVLEVGIILLLFSRSTYFSDANSWIEAPSAMTAGAGCYRVCLGAEPSVPPYSYIKGEKRMRAFVSILAGALLMMPAMAQSKDLSSDDQIREALVGNTVSGVEEGKSYVEFLQPDGRIDGEGRDGRYTGHWQIAKGQICFSYDDDEKASNWDWRQGWDRGVPDRLDRQGREILCQFDRGQSKRLLTGFRTFNIKRDISVGGAGRRMSGASIDAGSGASSPRAGGALGRR